MANSRKLIVEVIGDTSKLDKSFRRVETRSQKLGATFKRFGKAGAIGAGIAGTALLTKQLKSSVDAALEAERAQVRLAGAFESAGASRLQLAAATARIGEVSRQAAIDDEALSDSLANLTRTTGSYEKGLEGMALAANIARARGISLAAATKFVEKAFVGQLRGLKSVGVQIDKNTTATEAIDRAQRKFAGSAEQYGKTAAAAQERLGVAFENLQEKIGTKLLPVLERLSVKTIQLIEFSEKNWPKVAEAMQPFLDSLAAGAAGAEGVVGALSRIGKVKIPGTDSNLFKLLTLLDKFSPGGVVRGQLELVGKAAESGTAAVKREAAEKRAIKTGAEDKPEKKPTRQPTPIRVRDEGPSGRGGRSTQAVGGGGDIVIPLTVNLDGERIATSTTRLQQKNKRRNPPQKRGPNRVGGV